MILLFQGCSAKKRSVGTAIPKRSGNTKQKGLVTLFPHQVQSKIPPNVSNEVSIRLSEFPLLSMMSQTVIAQPCYGASDAIACHLFIYSAPSASSNVASAKRCGNAFPHEKKVWERRSHPTTPLFYFNCRIGWYGRSKLQKTHDFSSLITRKRSLLLTVRQWICWWREIRCQLMQIQSFNLPLFLGYKCLHSGCSYSHYELPFQNSWLFCCMRLLAAFQCYMW